MREGRASGPTIGIQKQADDAEAVAMMNGTRYSLTNGFTRRMRLMCLW